MKLDQQPEIIQRLRSAAGHLNAVIEMAESGQPCEDVLRQLSAVQAALRVVGTKIICCEAQCVREDLLNSQSLQETSAELHRLQSLYSIYVQHFHQTQEVNYD
jgi:DNA-binding FrmR family transcriptional regulator